MSAPVIADPAAIRTASRRRPRSRLRAVPEAPATRELRLDPGPDHPTADLADRPPAVGLVEALDASDAGQPLTVTISIDGGGEGRDRILAALRELVEAAGGDSAVALRTPARLVGNDGEPSVVRLDPKPRAAFRDGDVLDLSRLEYDLLLFLAEHPRQVFSRSQLLERVWGHVHTGARTVDVHISRLRQKLDDPELITTVYGIGYRLADGAPVRVV